MWRINAANCDHHLSEKNECASLTSDDYFTNTILLYVLSQPKRDVIFYAHSINVRCYLHAEALLLPYTLIIIISKSCVGISEGKQRRVSCYSTAEAKCKYGQYKIYAFLNWGKEKLLNMKYNMFLCHTFLKSNIQKIGILIFYNYIVPNYLLDSTGTKRNKQYSSARVGRTGMGILWKEVIGMVGCLKDKMK